MIIKPLYHRSLANNRPAYQIATEVYKLGGKGSMNDLPGPDDAKVKKWQQDFNPAYTDANELFAVSKALPGSTGTV